ncbi:conserved hypothetical protein [Paraburkholderia tropica]|uniref:hypothetical protein n=1 Tax=Paraburkholderia tropica TaxID=92647 RepID=UPI001CB429C2|nr:hypothetical protein [Paraburkholderia tropica]CAG9217755.1 conserved hypothetical protein [Paraburkholderia tropica]
MTAPRAQRRPKTIENSPAVRQMVKLVEPVDTELHPQPRVWTLTYRQNEVLAKYPLFFRSVHYPWTYSTNISHFGILCGGGWYPIIEALARKVESELRDLWREQIQFPERLAVLETARARGTSTFPVLPICTDITQVDGELKIEILYGSICPEDVAKRIGDFVEVAQVSSRYVCESCGRRGQYRESHWRRVYCDDCIAPEEPIAPLATPA